MSNIPAPPKGYTLVGDNNRPPPLPSGYNAAPRVDLETGAPPMVRMSVGAAPDEDRLATLKQYYPDAKPYGDNNFIYTDPNTGGTVLYNPRGFQPLSDVASVPTEIGEAVGGTVGAIGGGAAGALSGNPATVLGGAMLGAGTLATAGKEGVRAIMKSLGVPLVDTRTAAETHEDMKNTFMWNVAGEGGGTLAGAAAKAGFSGLIRGGKKGLASAQHRMALFKEMGATPSLGIVSGNRAIQGLEQLAAQFPGSSGHIAKKASATQKRIRDNVRFQIARLTKQTTYDPAQLAPSKIGGNVKEKLDQGVQNFLNEGRSQYANIDNYLPVDEVGDIITHTVKPTNTLNTLETIANRMEDAPNIGALPWVNSPAIRKALEAFEKDMTNGALTWGTIKQLRSAIGEQIASPAQQLAVGDIKTGQFKQLYKALSSDMAESFVDNPQALTAWTEANNFWSDGMTRIDDFIAPILKKVEPEKIFLELERAGRLGPTKLLAAKELLDPGEWDILQAAIINRMGRATPGAQDDVGEIFSTQTFLTNWSRLDNSAKDVLFDGAESSKAINKLAEASSLIRHEGAPFAEGAKSGSNFAGHGLIVGVTGGAIATGDPTFLVGIGVATLGANRSAALLTNPRFIKWATKATKLKPGQFGSHLARLSAIANGTEDTEVRQAIMDFLEVQRQVFSPEDNPNDQQTTQQ